MKLYTLEIATGYCVDCIRQDMPDFRVANKGNDLDFFRNVLAGETGNGDYIALRVVENRTGNIISAWDCEDGWVI